MDTFAIGDFATLDGFKVAKSPIAKVSIRLLVLKISYPKRKLFRSNHPQTLESVLNRGLLVTPLSNFAGALLGSSALSRFIVRGNSAQKTHTFARNTGALIPCLSFPVISVTFAVFRCCYVGLPHFVLPCPPLL